jgi:hypothetical protein
MRSLQESAFLFFSIFKSLNGGFRAAFLLRTMERRMRDLVRHYDAFGASPLEKPIAGNASSGAFGLLSAYGN